MTARLTSLPPEVLAIVFSHLRPRALRQCLLVNSAFRILAIPQLYSYIDVGGDTRSPTFSLLDENSMIKKEEPGRSLKPQTIPRDLSCLTVHSHEHCRERWFDTFTSPSLSSLILSCRVLKVHLGAPDDKDSIASVHAKYFGLNDNEGQPAIIPRVHPLHCHLLHYALEDAHIDKLVLHNVPVVYGNVDPDLLGLSAFKTVKEAVLVLNVDSMNSTNVSAIDWHSSECVNCQAWLGDDEGWQPCLQEEVLQLPKTGSMASALPPNVEELTVVFWTPRPGMEVTPSCCRALEPCSDCTEAGVEDDWSPDAKGRHRSCWEEEYWPNLAAAVAPQLLNRLRKLTIVNASAIIPAGAPRKQYLFDIATGTASHAKFEDKFGELLAHYLFSDHGITSARAEEYAERVHFMYMKDWLQTTEWEDVFASYKEVKPWLDFKPSGLITDYFKPHKPDAVQWRKDMDAMERIALRHRRSTMKRTKPNKYTWRK